jgi:hypothetical protein
MEVSEHPILILDGDAAHTMDLQGILFQEGFAETFGVDDNQTAELWLARHTSDVGIINPRLQDDSCRGIVSALVKQSVLFVLYLKFRRGVDSWLADGQWINKPCIPHFMLSAVKFAVAMRQVRTVVNFYPGEASASPAQTSAG